MINRIQGIELNSLYQSNADLMRALANTALAVRKIEIGLLEKGGAVTKLAAADVTASQQSLKRFIDAGTVTAHGKKLADAVTGSYKAYLDQSIRPMISALDKQYTDEYYQLLEGNLATLAAYNETKMKVLTKK